MFTRWDQAKICHLSKFVEKGFGSWYKLIAVDIVGKLPGFTDHNFFILTIIDYYPGYLEAIPLPNTKTEITRLLYFGIWNA